MAIKEGSSLVGLTSEQKNKIKNIVKETISSLSFFSSNLDNIDDDSVSTHLMLMEFALRDLSKETGYTSTEVKNLEKRNQEIRNLNNKINTLEKEKGNLMTAASITAGIKHYEDVFTCWYESIGFHYAYTKYRANGILAEFSEEIENKIDTFMSSDKELFELMKIYCMDDVLINKLTADFYISPMSRISNLMDTTANKEMLLNIFSKYFPNSKIRGFNSKFEKKEFTMSTTVFIPYSDLQNLEEKVKETIN